MRRFMNFGASGKVWKLPTLNGNVDVWLDTSDKSSLTIDGSGKVSVIGNKADPTKNFFQSVSGNQGTYTKNVINGRPAIVDMVGYVCGTTSSFIYMHDRSTAYAIFDVYKISVQGGSDIINSTTNGGNTNGFYTDPFGTYGLRNVIRQADAGETTSTDVVNTWSGNNKWAIGQWFVPSSVYYGHQVTGNDYELSVNGDAPIATQTESTTSTHTSLPHKYEFRMGLNGGVHSMAEKIIVKWPTQTRAQIDADITAIKNYIQNKYSLW